MCVKIDQGWLANKVSQAEMLVFLYIGRLIMGIDIATWRARIGLNCYHMCRPLRTRWGSSGVWLYQPGVASWGVGEVMNDTPLVLKGCLTVVALSLILQYAVHSWSKLKGRGGGGKVCCHWQGSTFQAKGKGVKRILDGGGTLLLRAYVVVLPLLLVRAGDVELNPGPEGNLLAKKRGADVRNVRAALYKVTRHTNFFPYTCIQSQDYLICLRNYIQSVSTGTTLDCIYKFPTPPLIASSKCTKIPWS